MTKEEVGPAGARPATRERGRPPKLPEDVRREVVLDAAVSRFAAVGRDAATVDEIATAAGVRKPGIYELFGSKDDLFRAAVEREVDALGRFFREVNAETAAMPPAERTRRRIEASVSRAESHPDAFRLLADAARSWPPDDASAGRAIRGRLVAVLAENYRRESRAAGVPMDAAAEVLARVFFAMTEQVILLCRSGARWDAAPLVDFLAAFIDGGLAAVPPDAWRGLERARPADRPDPTPRDG